MFYCQAIELTFQNDNWTMEELLALGLRVERQGGRVLTMAGKIRVRQFGIFLRKLLDLKGVPERVIDQILEIDPVLAVYYRFEGGWGRMEFKDYLHS